MKTRKIIRSIFVIGGLILPVIANAQLQIDASTNRITTPNTNPVSNLLLQSAIPGQGVLGNDVLSGNTIINYLSSGGVGIGLRSPSSNVRVDIDPTSKVVNLPNVTYSYRSALKLRAGIRWPSADPQNMAQILFSSVISGQFSHTIRSFHSGSKPQNALVFNLWTLGQTPSDPGNLEVMRLSDRLGGSVGIGAPLPEAKLHVSSGSFLVDGTTGGIPPGNGSRMMYIGERAAIRSGTVLLLDWEDLPIGNNSAAFGANATASGTNSFSVGAGTFARGTNSQAIGNFAAANGFASTAIGTNITAAANNSVVIGTGQTTLGSSTLTNNQESSLMVGFRSSRPTLFVGPSDGGTTTGNVGIGTQTPRGKLDVNGKVTIGEKLVTTGNHTDFMLSVDGKIISKSLVCTKENWADFVFEEDYPLLDLSQVESFIKSNKHLPGVPSENEVISKGLDLGEMDATLLMKIEELTLYLIQLSHEMQDVKRENDQLKDIVSNLEH